MGPLYYFNNTVYWLEGRPREGGRNVLCRYHPHPPPSSDNNNDNNDEVAGSSRISDVTPPTANVRSRVHEYGGGAVIFGSGGNNGRKDNHDGGDIYYTEFTTQQICRLVDEDCGSIPITIAAGDDDTTSSSTTTTNNNYRYADGVLSSNGKYIYCIREDHTIPTNVINEIVCIDIDSSSSSISGGGGTTGKTTIIATGNDFYSHPRLSPNDNNQLIYITWNHPAMPWDNTELRKIDNLSSLLSEEEDDEKKEKKLSLTKYHTLIAGNIDNNDDDDQEGTSILQPSFHPITGELYYISDESGYYNIYKQRQTNNNNNNNNKGVSVLPMSYDFGGPSPGWVLGQQGYTFMTDGRLVAQYSKDGKSILVIANVMTKDDNNDGAATNICEYIGGRDDNILPITFGGIVTSTTTNNDGSIYFLGGSPSTPTSIYRWDSTNPTLPARIIKCSSNVQFSSSIISTPRRIEFPTSNNKTAFGYYYPPRNDGYACTADDDDDVKSLPPLLVKAHGGPTSCTSCSYNAAIQSWLCNT